MIKDFFKSLLFVFVCAFCVFSARAAVSLFSDYGQIQNVQHYSSNPFWSPTAPYNQRLPQPVYATGTDLNSDDCIKVVQSLVSVQCMARDNCKNTDLSDIRPTVMVQLSNLPGANYVSACSGYIDGVFESYQKQYGNSLPNRAVAFPGATTPNTNIDDSSGIQFENPYKQQPTKWQMEQKERADELQRLQSQNGAGSEHLSKTDFPATYADLSFSERLENDRESLMPYKDASAYRTLNVKSKAEWCNENSNSPDCKESQQNNNNSNQTTQIHEDCSKYSKNTEAYDCCNYYTTKNAIANNVSAKWYPDKNQCLCEKFGGAGNMRWTWIWGAYMDGMGGQQFNHGECTPNLKNALAGCCERAGGTWILSEDKTDGHCDCGNGKKLIQKTTATESELMQCECVADNDESNGTNQNLLVARIHKRASTSDRTGKTGNSGRGCFAICGTNPLDDDLNTKVFSNFRDGSRYCADKNQAGLLVKSAAGGMPLQMTTDEYKTLKEKIQSEVANKGKCDWHGRDYIIEIGHIYSDSFSADYETIVLDD